MRAATLANDPKLAQIASALREQFGARLVSALLFGSRARGDYRQAVAAYQIALSATRSRDVAEAAGFHRAACLVRLGDATGVDAARAYLRSHPDGRFKKQAAALVEQGVPANH